MRSHHPTLSAVVQRLEEHVHMGTPLYQVLGEFRKLRDEAAKQPPELEDAMDAALGRLTSGDDAKTIDRVLSQKGERTPEDNAALARAADVVEAAEDADPSIPASLKSKPKAKAKKKAS